MLVSTRFQLLRLLLLILTFKNATSCMSKSSQLIRLSASDNGYDYFACGICGGPIDVTLVFNNELQEPFFHFNVTVVNRPQRTLLHFLERAADQDKRARFTAVYWGSLGYSINSINKVKANSQDKSYWRILEHASGNGLKLGVSSYIPMNQEVIQFNFTTWG